LIDYTAGGEDAALSVPTPDHYLPLLYIAALQAEDERMSMAVDGIDKGSLSMLTVVVGAG
jgi:4,5-DOPA dioxygenase extradiol